GVHPGVGASGDREPRRRPEPQNSAQGSLEVILNRAEARLGGPSVEGGAVVGQLEPDTQPPAGPGVRTCGRHGARGGRVDQMGLNQACGFSSESSAGSASSSTSTSSASASSASTSSASASSASASSTSASSTSTAASVCSVTPGRWACSASLTARR